MRIDKWLWAARFFKTRALASKACDLGRVESNGQPAKPSREVRVGDLVSIKSEAGNYQIQVLSLSEMRGPAAVAQALYSEAEASRDARLQSMAERKALFQAGAAPDGKPSKRDRRELDRFRGR